MVSQNLGVNPHFIASIILIESAGKPWACRFEPKWSYTTQPSLYARKIGASVETEINMQMTSWGLMQVMGTVARELGFNGWLSELCDPNVGILYGSLKLKSLIEKHGNLEDAVASYNAGSPKRRTDGKYINQDYVDRFKRVFIEINQVA